MQTETEFDPEVDWYEVSWRRQSSLIRENESLKRDNHDLSIKLAEQEALIQRLLNL